MAGDDLMPRREFPCNVCPVRRDNADTPQSKFPVKKWAQLKQTVTGPDGNEAGLGAILFGCHKGEPGTNADLACAGWLAAFGDRHLGVRLAVIQGRLPATALHPAPNWPALYDDWDEMAAAQQWNPGDPDDHLPTACRTAGGVSAEA